jgi:hypothetical protein
VKLVLGNRDAVQSLDNGETFERMPKGKRATVIGPFEDDVTVVAAVRIVDSVWKTHAAEGAVPAWVASDHGLLAELTAQHFGGIEVRELEE